jgi:hypothetical protein
VSAGVGDVATVLPVLEPCVRSHYFLDTPCIILLFYDTSPRRQTGVKVQFKHEIHIFSAVGVVLLIH